MDIKKIIKGSKVKQWQIAENIGITEFKLSRMLRHPERIPEDIVNDILKAINTIKAAYRKDSH